jgi:hypothetical protein
LRYIESFPQYSQSRANVNGGQALTPIRGRTDLGLQGIAPPTGIMVFRVFSSPVAWIGGASYFFRSAQKPNSVCALAASFLFPELPVNSILPFADHVVLSMPYIWAVLLTMALGVELVPVLK